MVIFLLMEIKNVRHVGKYITERKFYKLAGKRNIFFVLHLNLTSKSSNQGTAIPQEKRMHIHETKCFYAGFNIP